MTAEQKKSFLNNWSLKDILIILGIGINIGVSITRLNYIEKSVEELGIKVKIIQEVQSEQKITDNNQNNEINNLKIK